MIRETGGETGELFFYRATGKKTRPPDEEMV